VARKGLIIFKISKWLHKYIGLALILFLMWMSLSGVLMNHPDLIAGIYVPRLLVPLQYHPTTGTAAPDFRINFEGKFVYIQYYAVRDEQGNYKGVLEITYEAIRFRSLEGEKRLLDWG
jgi:hypothetical protein